MARLVIFDYLDRGWSEGTLRFDLYYPERMYGGGGGWNQHYVEGLGFFDVPATRARCQQR